MRRLPIRVRLALVFALAMAIVLSASGLLVYVRVGSDLDRSLDEQLRGRVQDLSALVRGGGSVRSTRGSLLEPGESFAELVTRDGRVLDSTPPIGRSVLLTRAELARARTSATFVDKPSVPGLDEGARLLAAPLGHEVIVAGVTRENRAEVLRTLRNAFLLGGPLALLLTALGGYALAGAALRPIEAMRRRAHAISVESLQERLPVPPADDEVARLGETLNAMLARLEAGVERERRFVADASHELRTPLALLKTELELALRQPLSADELRAALEAAADASARLERLAEDLLVLARADQGRLRLAKSEVDVLDVLQSVARSFEPRVAVERRAIAIADADAPVVVADRLRLEQAVANLVDNALRHGAGNVTLLARSRDGRTELHVLDSGAGFDPRFAQRAFDRFSRADEARSDDGAGLGLAIVAMIARAHGGDAHVRNRPEGGADAWIELPAREPATAARTP